MSDSFKSVRVRLLVSLHTLKDRPIHDWLTYPERYNLKIIGRHLEWLLDL
jgi:hypothetical protein